MFRTLGKSVNIIFICIERTKQNFFDLLYPDIHFIAGSGTELQYLQGMPVAANWKQPKNPTTGEWINKSCFIRRMGYYLAIRKNELLIHSVGIDESQSEFAEHKVYIQYNSIYIKL